MQPAQPCSLVKLPSSRGVKYRTRLGGWNWIFSELGLGPKDLRVVSKLKPPLGTATSGGDGRTWQNPEVSLYLTARPASQSRRHAGHNTPGESQYHTCTRTQLAAFTVT